MVPTVRVPPRTGEPVPTPGFEPGAAVELDDPELLDEQLVSAVDAAAPSITAPPVAAPRDRKVRRLIPLPDVKEFPHHALPVAVHRWCPAAGVALRTCTLPRVQLLWGHVTAKWTPGP